MKRPRSSDSQSRNNRSTRRERLLPRTPSWIDSTNTKPRYSSVQQASQFLQLPPTKTCHFFDALPDDALIIIIQRLARFHSLSPHQCPLLQLATVSPNLRRVISQNIGSRLAFSVYGDADWFWMWLAITGPYLRDISLHNRSYRTAGDVRHMWPMWPRCLTVELDAFSTMTALHFIKAPLTDLDISGLPTFRRTALTALSQFLSSIRNSLRSLKIDITRFRIAHALRKARLFHLRRLVVVNLDSTCEDQLMPILQSLQPNSHGKHQCLLKELYLDACEIMPTVIRRHRHQVEKLLPNLETFHIDFDNERQLASDALHETLTNLTAATTLPSVKRVSLSGSGIPVRAKLINQIKHTCHNLLEFRLIDCDIDVDPDVKEIDSDYSNINIIEQMGGTLTHYYPRWLTFKLDLLESLAKHSSNLTHVRIFTGLGAEQSLLKLATNLRYSLVDLEIYPKSHNGKREISPWIVKFVSGLDRLERLCLVTLDLSTAQLKDVLQHCGSRLKCFAFSPPADPNYDPNDIGRCIADVFLHAAVWTPNVHRIECIFQNDMPPRVSCTEVTSMLRVATRLLESRAVKLESANLWDLVEEMIADI